VLLIFGFRTKAYALGWVAAVCHVCGRSGTLMLVRETTRLSLFFIPLIPVRTKYVLECQNPACRSRTRIDKREAERLRAAGVSPVQPTVRAW
jgi:zinc ribbon protein